MVRGLTLVLSASILVILVIRIELSPSLEGDWTTARNKESHRSIRTTPQDGASSTQQQSLRPLQTNLQNLPLVPSVRSDCEVKIRHPEQALCYSASSVWDQAALAISQRLLQHASHCRINSLRVVNLDEEKHPHCLELHPRLFYLLPFLYQDYYALATIRKHHAPTYCVVDTTQDPYKGLETHLLNPNHQNATWQSFYQQARWCDYMATPLSQGLLLADSLEIPGAFLTNNTDTRTLNRTLLTLADITNFRFYPHRVHNNWATVLERKNYARAKAIADTFPYHLFQTEPRHDTDPSNNKTLVVIIGSLRGGEAAWQSLYRHVLDVNQADLALMIGNATRSTSSLYARAKHVWEFPEYSDWADAIDTIAGPSWRTELKVNPAGGVLGGVQGHSGSGAIIFMARYWLLQRIRHLPYERFVVTRSDFVYKCRHNLSLLDSDAVWVPEGQDFGGITDRHVIASKHLIHKVLNILEPMIRRPERYFVNVLSGNPESIIRAQWTREAIYPHQVKRFPRPMYVGFVEGDVSRWGRTTKKKKRHGKTEEGVYAKYLGEYYFAKCYCGGGQIIDLATNSTRWDYTDAYQSFSCV